MDKILLLPGDGIGKAMMDSVRSVLDASAEGIEFLEGNIGASAYETTGSHLPRGTMEMASECGAALCGPIDLSQSSVSQKRDPVNILRIQLDLYAVCKRFRTLADDLGKTGIDTSLWFCSPAPGRDTVETEDFDGITLTKYVRKGNYSRMMAKAMSYAEIEHKKKAVCITSDIFPESSGMFRDCFRNIFGTGSFELSEETVRRWAASAVRRPGEYGTVVCAELFGQVAGSILAGLTGGNHLSPDVYVGDDQILAVTGSVPQDVDGKYANPTSLIIGGCLAFSDFGMEKESRALMDALCDAYAAGERTPDVGGTLTAEEFSDRIIRRL
jgi:isocitrate/isopropylmalate dehydrogenase